MKRLKKTLALALALILALAMSTAVFAEGTSTEGSKTYELKITSAPTGHSYEAYQIFTGDLVTTETKNDTTGEKTTTRTLSNVVWGDGVSAITKDGKTTQITAGKSATEEAETVAKLASSQLKAYINSLTLNTENAIQLTDNKDGTYTATGLNAGYYVVKDQDNSVDTIEGDEYTAYIVQVVGDVKAEAKTSQTTSEKKVKDINDSDGKGETGWQDSADYDIGDAVPFQLTATITKNYAAYENYYLAFHDKEADGLTFDKGSVKVYVGDTQISDTLYEVITPAEGKTELDDGDTFEVVFSNLKNVTEVKAESVIRVEYKAVLNEDAVLGSTGNKNTMHIEYSNNPNVTGDETTGKTPDDTVIVFTYKVVINKIDQAKNTLAGAEFTLYKKDASITKETDGYEKIGESYYKIIKVENWSRSDTTFSFEGLDDGDYILSETTTPDGYNTVADMSFTVTATHDVEEDNPKLQTLTGDTTTGTIYTDISDWLTPDKTAGSLTADIVNNQGSVLPSTGGTGRVLLYVVGAILVVGVGVILVSKKRAQQ
jgi:fimbrial isopeptide formation D2 family protein/LPXTG-motif cell wall-anchored protein